MASDGAADDDVETLLRDFEPLPDAVFSTGGPTESSDAASAEEAAAVSSSGRVTPPKRATTLIGYSAGSDPSISDGSRRARYRARSRNELMYLREVVRDLELELERCKRRVSAPIERDSAFESTQAVIWEALAARERTGRQRAEAENARLRVLLDSQLRFAAELQQVLRRRATGESVSVTPGPCRVAWGSADAGVLERYLAEMDSVRTRTDAVLEQSGIDLRPESTHRFVRTNRGGGAKADNRHVEFLDTHVIRADLETARHIWPLVVEHYLRRDGAVYEPRTPQARVHSFTYRFPHKWLGRDSAVAVTQAVKTFDERDRQVNVYRVLSVGEGALAGLAVDETGWSVLSRSRSNPRHTICRVVARLTPMRFRRREPRSPMDAPPQLMEVAKVLFQVCDGDVGKTIAMLEARDPETGPMAMQVVESR